MSAAGVRPLHPAVAHAEIGILGDVEDIRVELVDRVAFGLDFHPVAEMAHGVFEGDVLGEDRAARVELLPEHVGRKRDGAAGVLLFAIAEQIGGVADLGFDFLLAIAVVIVGDDRDHDAAAIAAGQLERAAAVVRLVRIAPAHAVAALAFGGPIEMGQAQVLLLHAGEVRRQDDAAAMSAPVDGIERGVVFRQVGIAAVAENAFHEIEIADQAGGREEADLHGLLGIAGRVGADQRDATGAIRTAGPGAPDWP